MDGSSIETRMMAQKPLEPDTGNAKRILLDSLITGISSQTRCLATEFYATSVLPISSLMINDKLVETAPVNLIRRQVQRLTSKWVHEKEAEADLV